MNLRKLTTPSGRLLSALLIACGLAMIGAVWLYFQEQKRAIRNAAMNELLSVASFKSAQIANWRRERLGDGRTLASSPLMLSAQRVLAGKDRPEDRPALQKLLGKLSDQFLYTDALLVDRDGAVRLTLQEDRRADHLAQQAAFGEAVREALAKKDVLLGDLAPLPPSGKPMMLLCVPVEDLGAVLLAIDPERFLYPYLKAWPVPTTTAESFLVRLDGPNAAIALSPLRYAPDAALKLTTRNQSPNLPSESVLARGWPGTKVDYHGALVLRAVQSVPDSPWFLVALIAQSEVETPLDHLAWEMALVTALIALSNAAGVGLIWRNRKLQAAREREEWFESIANDTPAYLWMSSASGATSFMNRPLRKFLGIDPATTDVDWTAGIREKEREAARAFFRASLAERREYRFECEVGRADGARRSVVVRGIPLSSPRGEFLGYAGSFADVTEAREAEKQLRSANQVLAQELKERERAEQEIHALNARLINAQEEERTRIARELHDDISQQIAALSMGVGRLKRKLADQPEAVDDTMRFQEKLVHLAESTRRLSHELHPSVLQHAGLAAALQNYCAELSELTSHRITFRTAGDCDGLPAEAALCVYRVAQEALQNSIKHAGVTEAEVRLENPGGEIRLTVSDRGVGMNGSATGGLGLVSIKERARLVNARVEIRSAAGEGLALTLRVPV